VAVGIEIIFPVAQFAGRIQFLAEQFILADQNVEAEICSSISITFTR
jgi:hypothetical protein